MNNTFFFCQKRLNITRGITFLFVCLLFIVISIQYFLFIIWDSYIFQWWIVFNCLLIYECVFNIAHTVPYYQSAIFSAWRQEMSWENDDDDIQRNARYAFYVYRLIGILLLLYFLYKYSYIFFTQIRFNWMLSIIIKPDKIFCLFLTAVYHVPLIWAAWMS